MTDNACIYANLATYCKLNNMENKYRFVSITRYAEMCKISREAVYKRIKSGKTKLLDMCEVPVVDLAFSKGTDDRIKWKEIPEYKLPF